MLASEYLYLAIVIFVIIGITLGLTLAGQDILVALQAIPGYDTLNASIANVPGAISPYQATNTILAIYPNFDQYIPLVFFLISIAILASVILLPTSALSIALTFVIMVITVFVSIIFSNQSAVFFGSPLFANVIHYFPNTIALFTSLPYYQILFFFVYIILIAAKIRLTGGLGGGGGNGGHAGLNM